MWYVTFYFVYYRIIQRITQFKQSSNSKTKTAIIIINNKPRRSSSSLLLLLFFFSMPSPHQQLLVKQLLDSLFKESNKFEIGGLARALALTNAILEGELDKDVSLVLGLHWEVHHILVVHLPPCNLEHAPWCQFPTPHISPPSFLYLLPSFSFSFFFSLFDSTLIG